MKPALALLLSLSFLAYCLQPALADEVECDGDATPQKCADEYFSSLDKAHNLAYQQLMKSIASEGKSKLRDTQRLWLQFVEKNCRFEASAYKGGSLESMTYSRCMARNTEIRTKELVEQYKLCSETVAC